MAFSEGNQLFAGDLHVFLDEINAYMLHRNRTVNGMSNIKDTFAENFQQQLSVPHQSMCNFRAGLLSISDEWVKHKEKIADMSDSNQSDCISQTQVYRTWFIHQKGAEKLVKDKLCM